MKLDEVLRGSRRVRPDEAAVARWRRAVFAAEAPVVPVWVPNLASVVAMAGMLMLLWPAAARGPVALRAAGVACDGRWEQAVPLRADVRGVARPVPVALALAAPEQCGLCHLTQAH